MSENKAKKMYVIKEGPMYVLRQERFRHLLESGREHPHDTCAYARSIGEMKRMLESTSSWVGQVQYPDEEQKR